VTFPRATPVAMTPKGEMTLTGFDLVDFVLLADDEAQFAPFAAKLKELLPAAADFAAKRAAASRDKHDLIWRRIQSAMPRDAHELYAKAVKATESAAGKAPEQAFESAQDASRIFGQLAGRCIAQAESDWKANPRYRQYYDLLGRLVESKLLTDDTAALLGHTPSYHVPENLLAWFGRENFLFAHFFVLDRFYGAFSDDEKLDALCHEVAERLKAQKPNLADADRARLVQALQQRDFSVRVP